MEQPPIEGRNKSKVYITVFAGPHRDKTWSIIVERWFANRACNPERRYHRDGTPYEHVGPEWRGQCFRILSKEIKKRWPKAILTNTEKVDYRAL